MDHVPIASLVHAAGGGYTSRTLATTVGVRLTPDDGLEYATRSLRIGGHQTLADGLGSTVVHEAGPEPWSTSRSQLLAFLRCDGLPVDVAEMLYPLARHDQRSDVESRARQANMIDLLLADWVADDARRFGEVRIGMNWVGASPGRHLPDYEVLPDGASVGDAADALERRLAGHDDVVALTRSAVPDAMVRNLTRGTLVEHWDLHLGDLAAQTMVRVTGAELWAYPDGEVALRMRHVDGLRVARSRVHR